MMDEHKLRTETLRRRTFAIISHPDAGKTTLTEKLPLHGGAIHLAGAVKARGAQRHVTSDWMELERQRGISVTSSVLQFEHQGHRINLLDTPGHQDFSEDTYRTLAAADAAVMLIDSAKGVEAQTRKLFQVCRRRGIPIFTFVNKMDRLGREPFDNLHEVEEVLGIRTCPITWPIGQGPDFKGVFTLFDESWQRRKNAPEKIRDDVELLEAAGDPFDLSKILAGELSPAFFGSAMTEVGVDEFLADFVRIAPPPGPRVKVDGAQVQPVEPQFSGFVFKVQANMNPAHRDRLAFLRVCSGHFERGMVLTHGRTGKPFATKYAHQVFGQERITLDDAFPGDVIGLVNATEVRVGDTLYLDEPAEFPRLPAFAPTHFAVARVKDTQRFKQFRKAVAQLDEEGVVQVLRDLDLGDQMPMFAAVGPMQFDVAMWRLEHEFNAPATL